MLSQGQESRIPSIWTGLSFGLAALVLFPVISIAVLGFQPAVPNSSLGVVLPRYLGNTLLLMLLVGAGAGILGTLFAWWVVVFEFPLRRQLEWALLLPLALPPYLMAFILADLLEFAGPVQTWIRGVTGWGAGDYYFPPIRSLGGAAFVLTISLYPYTYLFVRAVLRRQASSAIDVARTLGAGRFRVFWTILIPIVWPATAAGVALAVMESIAEFGAMEFFGVQTLTTGIFTLWLEARDIPGAARLALVGISLVVIVVALERRLARSSDNRLSARSVESGVKLEPTAWGRCGILGVITLTLGLGFVVPVARLVGLIDWRISAWRETGFMDALLSSVWLAGLAAGLIVLFSIVVVFGLHLVRGQIGRWISRVMMLGYALPGAVLGLGVLIPLVHLDRGFADWLEGWSGYDPGLILTGSVAAIVIAYVIRFFAIGIGGVEGAFSKIPENVSHAARSLGAAPGQVLRRIHVPMSQSALVAAFLLVFLDALKELPATLMLRPFGLSTLSTEVYEQASLENYSDAAQPALILVLAGLAAVALVARSRLSA